MLLPLLLAALASAQVHPGEVSHALGSVSVAGTAVSLWSTEKDRAIAEQVQRVLPRALRIANR